MKAAAAAVMGVENTEGHTQLSPFLLEQEALCLTFRQRQESTARVCGACAHSLLGLSILQQQCSPTLTDAQGVSFPSAVIFIDLGKESDVVSLGTMTMLR